MVQITRDFCIAHSGILVYPKVNSLHKSKIFRCELLVSERVTIVSNIYVKKHLLNDVNLGSFSYVFFLRIYSSHHSMRGIRYSQFRTLHMLRFLVAIKVIFKEFKLAIFCILMIPQIHTNDRFYRTFLTSSTTLVFKYVFFWLSCWGAMLICVNVLSSIKSCQNCWRFHHVA